MPTYRLRYVCETPLRFDRDVSLGAGSNEVLFLFSQKRGNDSTVNLRVDVDAENYLKASVLAQTVLMPAIDALSFSTGTPLLILHWDFVIKSEAGHTTRRALWCERRLEPAAVPLTPGSVGEANEILRQAGGPSLPLLWHRYALQRNLILDRFLFQWLAFEGVSGKTQVAAICPKCQQEVQHCARVLSHEGCDRRKAYAIFSQSDSTCSERDFNREIWGSARNSVFHGTKIPTPEFLAQLQSLSPKLRRACEREFARVYGVDERPRPQRDLEWSIYRYNMFEWRTVNPQEPFADDFPWDAVQREFGNMEPEEVRMQFPDTWPFKLLNFQVDSASW